MPYRANGRGLLERLLEIAPSTTVINASGRANDLALENHEAGGIAGNIACIYTIGTLVKVLRSALNENQRSGNPEI